MFRSLLTLTIAFGLFVNLSINVGAMASDEPANEEADSSEVVEPVAEASDPTATDTSVATVSSSDAIVPSHDDLQSDGVLAIAPAWGTSWYSGRWHSHVTTDSALGLIIEKPLAPSLSLEAEFGYSRQYVRYHYEFHPFSRFECAANAKVYLWRSIINPYLGLGTTAIHYRGVKFGAVPAFTNRWLGAGQVLGGFEIRVSPVVSLGARLEWVIPVFGKPYVSGGEPYAIPGWEEASMISAPYGKVMGALRIAL